MAPKSPSTVKEWLECLALPEYLAVIPAGCIRPIVGPVQWIDGSGTRMSTEQYQATHGIDPQLAWDAVKAYRAESGKKDKVFKI